MTCDRNAPGEDELSFTSANEELRLLITQFYENAVRRYGPASEQARILSGLRCPRDSEGLQREYFGHPAGRGNAGQRRQKGTVRNSETAPLDVV